MPNPNKKIANVRDTAVDMTDDQFRVDDTGVYWIDAGSSSPKDLWLCSKLDVVAMTRNESNANWGRLLEWADADGVVHTWAVPLAMLQSDGAEFRAELASQGVRIASKHGLREKLLTYASKEVPARARCVDRPGWYGNVFVTPNGQFGETDERIVLQSSSCESAAWAVSGTVEEWIDGIGKLIVGNSRLVLAASVALAAPLVRLLNLESAGFHFRGGSSVGKTSALHIAASIWGPPRHRQKTWRATANGLEGIAAGHNDCLLVIDELSQIDPNVAGEAAYMLANGQGKSRATKTGQARATASWRLLFLSTGEQSLGDLMRAVGRTPNAGQEIRFLDLEADAGAGSGICEQLNGFSSPRVFVEHLTATAEKLHGSVGREWLREIAKQNDLGVRIGHFVEDFVSKSVPKSAGSQAQRVARFFGLVACAGELASEFGLTGWNQGEALRAAETCFDNWLAGFGSEGNSESRKILEHVRGVFERHGSSRFECMSSKDTQRIVNRIGYKQGGADYTQYIVLPNSYASEICAGFNQQQVTRVLKKAGWLELEDKKLKRVSVPGVGRVRCYVFTRKAVVDDETDVVNQDTSIRGQRGHDHKVAALGSDFTDHRGPKAGPKTLPVVSRRSMLDPTVLHGASSRSAPDPMFSLHPRVLELVDPLVPTDPGHQ